MDNREDVIKGLQCLLLKGEIFWDKCENCPFSNNPESCINKINTDAIALLKAQEPIAPVKVNRYMETDENGDWFTPETYDCGNCGVELHGKANYCHLCGRAVKWHG